MYKFEIRNSFIKALKRDLPDTIYHYEPDIDPEIIEGRLLMNVFLYAHVNHCGDVFTTPQTILSYLGVDSGKQNWRAGIGTRVVDKGLAWMIQNGYASFDDGAPSSILDYTYKDWMLIHVDDSLFDMYCIDLKETQPYIRVYQQDIEKILSVKKAKTYKLFRVYCYIRSCMRNVAPYGWVVTYKEIEDATGYSHKYIVRAVQILCDELGVLHRQQLRRIGTNVPPYCYIFNISGWEKYLKQAINGLYKVKDGGDEVAAEDTAAAEKPVEDEYYTNEDGERVRDVTPEDLPPDIRKALLGY